MDNTICIYNTHINLGIIIENTTEPSVKLFYINLDSNKRDRLSIKGEIVNISTEATITNFTKLYRGIFQ